MAGYNAHFRSVLHAGRCFFCGGFDLRDRHASTSAFALTHQLLRLLAFGHGHRAGFPFRTNQRRSYGVFARFLFLAASSLALNTFGGSGFPCISFSSSFLCCGLASFLSITVLHEVGLELVRFQRGLIQFPADEVGDPRHLLVNRQFVPCRVARHTHSVPLFDRQVEFGPDVHAIGHLHMRQLFGNTLKQRVLRVLHQVLVGLDEVRKGIRVLDRGGRFRLQLANRVLRDSFDCGNPLCPRVRLAHRRTCNYSGAFTFCPLSVLLHTTRGVGCVGLFQSRQLVPSPSVLSGNAFVHGLANGCPLLNPESGVCVQLVLRHFGGFTILGNTSGIGQLRELLLRSVGSHSAIDPEGLLGLLAGDAKALDNRLQSIGDAVVPLANGAVGDAGCGRDGDVARLLFVLAETEDTGKFVLLLREQRAEKLFAHVLQPVRIGELLDRDSEQRLVRCVERLCLLGALGNFGQIPKLLRGLLGGTEGQGLLDLFAGAASFGKRVPRRPAPSCLVAILFERKLPLPFLLVRTETMRGDLLSERFRRRLPLLLFRFRSRHGERQVVLPHLRNEVRRNLCRVERKSLIKHRPG